MFVAVLLAAALSASQVQAIETTVRQGMAKRQIPSVVVRIDLDGKNVYSRAFGYRDLADRLPAAPTTRYQYGSITKQFTAAAILALMSDGKLSIDDRVGRWLPEFAKFPVTIRQVLVHTSGIADFSSEEWYVRKHFGNPAVGPDPLLAWSASQRLQFTPGTRAVYDNAGYTALARIIEKASGMQFFAFLSKRFLTPMHMTSVAPQSFFGIQPNTARGYMIVGKQMGELIGLPVDGRLLEALPWNLRQVDGAGFLVGDAADLQTWDNALLDGRVLSGKAAKLFHTEGRLANGKPAYTGPENPAHKPGVYLLGGLGRFEVDGVNVYGANGGTTGFLSFTATIPSKRLSITILSNHGNDIDNSRLTVPIVQAILR